MDDASSNFGTPSVVATNTLAVGDIIFTPIIIDRLDMADPNATSGTAKKIKKGLPVERFCVVLSTNNGIITVTYLATFDLSTTLPSTLDKSLWYPVAPAVKEGQHGPLPPLNAKAQWASLRKMQQVAELQVTKYSVAVGANPAALILAAMKS